MVVRRGYDGYGYDGYGYDDVGPVDPAVASMPLA
jgi:hypothetical protein